jgi:hypothetical protein
MSEKTPEQIAAEATAAQAAADAKAAKEAIAAQKKAEKDAAAAQKAAEKAQKDAAKATEKAEKDAAKAAKAQEKADAQAAKDKEKADKVAAKQAAKQAKQKPKMPEENGVPRPGAEGLCGQAWAVFDEVSGAQNAACSIAQALEVAKTRGLNEGNVRTEYARWKKFNGLAGKITAPVAEIQSAEPSSTEQAAA